MAGNVTLKTLLSGDGPWRILIQGKSKIRGKDITMLLFIPICVIP